MKSEVSFLKQETGRPLLRDMLNVFGGKREIAAAFGVANKTVSNWFTPTGRGPGHAISDRMQPYLPGQQVTVHVEGNRRDRDTTYSPTILLNREEGIKYMELVNAGKTEAARVYLLAEQHGAWEGVPSLAGASWEDDFPYDDEDFDDWPDADGDYYLE